MPSTPLFHRYRLTLGCLFIAQGALTAAAPARQSAFQIRFGLSAMDWAQLLIAIGVGGVVAYPLIRWLLTRFSSQKVCFHAGWMAIAVLFILCWAPNIPILLAGFFLQGVVASALNAAINRQGAQLEMSTGKRTLGFFHGIYYLGLGGAAGIAAASANYGLSLPAYMAVLALILLPILVIASMRLLPEGHLNSNVSTPVANDLPSQPAVVTVPATAKLGLLTLGLLTLVAAIVEGAIQGWGPLFLTSEHKATESVAAIALTIFSLAMMGGRLIADIGATRFGPSRWLKCGALVAAFGAGLAFLSPTPYFVWLAFALLGAGQAAFFPILYSAAGRLGSAGSASIVAFASAGSLLGPALFALIAQQFAIQHVFAATFGLLVLSIPFW